MASAAFVNDLNRIADTYPYWVGWLNSDEFYDSFVNLNGPMLSHDPAHFPIQVRIRVYADGEKIVEYFTEEMRAADFWNVHLNPLIGPRSLRDGYFEVTVFPKNKYGLKVGFFSEVWGTVLSRDGRTALNYPMLLCKGADPSMVDSSYLYYPGVTCDEFFLPRLVIMNHHDFENEYDVTLYDAGGRNELKKTFAIPKKSLQNQNLMEVFPNLPEFFREGPGLLIFHFKYKMNGFVQTYQYRKKILSGMDHLGLLFASYFDQEKVSEEERDSVLSNRLTDPLICFCKAMSEGCIRTLLGQGMPLAEIQEQFGAGTVCLGCAADLEKLSGEKAIKKRRTRAINSKGFGSGAGDSV